MKLDEQLRDRGRDAPVRPGGGNEWPSILLGVIVAASGLIFAVSHLRDQGERVVSDPQPRSEVAKPLPARTDMVSGPAPVRPAGSPQTWVSDDDYPHESLRLGEQGSVGFVLDIDTSGRPVACHITRSSGHERLDRTACTLLMRRARFHPARDENGQTITSTFRSRFTWRIPQ